ncbi:hypothetical protein WMY93_032960 [Mugilogobius chulae]|uniref:BPTI/Kunitz inhibitor domain-containing protein n=1 Tax=Mugilogobius chulae TaxID=88201 RepID=A0AAW0MJG0_9GOBI
MQHKILSHRPRPQQLHRPRPQQLYDITSSVLCCVLSSLFSCAADVCSLAVDSGLECGSYRRRWYFDPALGACAPFWFGGCGGNDNRFSSEHECLQTCVRQHTNVVLRPQTEILSKDVCSLDQDPAAAQTTP